MKYLFEPVSKKQIEKFLKDQRITDIVLNIQDLSFGITYNLTVDAINNILNKTSKNVSINVKRLFHEYELIALENTLKSINLEKVSNIFYSDLAVYDIVKSLGYENKLVYDAFTYLTNYLDVEEYNSFNKSVVVSNQISKEEIDELLSKITKPVMIHGFGKSVIFYSKRKLITNYFNYRDVSYKANLKNYYLQEELRSELYHIYEDENATYIYEKGYYYLFNELNNIDKVETIIIESSDLKESDYDVVVEAYLNNDLELLKSLPIDLSKGIMENKSVLLKKEVN